ncbi:DUF6475 domain-containing protein [Marinobacter adhaerens]|uniref:DUF6475 domain-containing protein n=2 Tax=Marinobacter adhaerens TaxID=1033846 RepID=A0ABX8IL11_9GAMM|nr:DUF6475 domain-containing protein [Marinobacter adhaerens]ADP96445.1 conserved hypothetical protein [Marinobacter adhaerens HP15]QWV14435.1 hypothetical protein KQ249_07530 [Marinobacter adhaerens]
MNTNDLEAFDSLWAQAYEIYGKRMEPRVVYMVFQSLIAFSLADIERAISRHVTNPDTGQYPPKPADIVRLLQGSSQSASGEAWAKVDRAIRCVGNYRSVVFDDPKIHAAIERLGGWQKISMTEEKEYPFLRNNFQKLYQGFTFQPPESFPRKLIGTCEHENSQHEGFNRGRPQDEPVMIGNPEKARMVYQGGGDMGVARIQQHGTKEFLELAVDSAAKRIGGVH